MSERAYCEGGGWVFGTKYPFPMDATVYRVDRAARVPCNQLYCSFCQTPVKHMEGVQAKVRRPANLGALYDSLEPDAFIDIVELSDEYRLYYCRCNWYSTTSGKPVGHLDSNDIDNWACAGHLVPG